MKRNLFAELKEGTSALSANGGNRLDQRIELRDVVAIRAGPLGSGQFFSRQHGANRRTVDNGARHVELAATAQFRKQCLVHALADASLLPRNQSSPASSARAAAHLLR